MAGSEEKVPVVDDQKVVEDELDLEDEELQAAEEALKAAEKEPEPSDDDAKKVDETVVPTPEEGEKKDPVLIPVGVAVDLRKKNQGLKEHIAHLQGQVAIYEKGQQTGEKALPEKTPEEQIAEIHQQRLDMAGQFEDGSVSAVDLEKTRLELEAKERDIRSASQPQALPVEAQPTQDLALEEHTRTLEEKYPSILKATEGQLKPLQEIARQKRMEQHGIDYPDSAQGTADLRTDIAILHESIYGTKPTPGTEVVKPAELSDSAKAREQKLKLAQGHPVDTSALGTQTDTVLVTDEQAMAKLSIMNDDEAIDFLDKNPALKQRLGVDL